MSDHTHFEKTLRNLERYHKVYMEQRVPGNIDLEELNKMGLIKSFGICYAALLKALRRHLMQESGVLELGEGAKAIFRAADRNALLGDGAEHWFEYTKARNITSYEYGIEKPSRVLELIPAFIDDTIKLYETMTGVPWKRAMEKRIAQSASSDERDTVDLKKTHHRIVRQLLEEYLPGTKVWAFGSRVTFKSRRTSDLDLVAFADDSLQDRIHDLREAFEESDLPFEVDVLVWDRIPEYFKPNIEQAYYVLQSGASIDRQPAGIGFE
ncbi:MAG: nucleotidyltransferase substrate binding protein [Ectothiorhodospiraceae bacterium AqS1]|nr:nucleotidyltransferase substrate binding protein [Ectothiorhodospiraceae bacterium AqS1]